MKAACDKITAGENDSKLGCFAGQYNKYEGLTVNFDEAVHGAGGVIVVRTASRMWQPRRPPRACRH